MEIRIELPIGDEAIDKIKVGDTVLLSGEMYVARDAAHERLYKLITEGKPLPMDIKNATVYYMGPSPGKGRTGIGAAGPTTAGRMDKYTPLLLDMGLKCMIGKGQRSPEVIASIKQNHALYLAAVGGAGALLGKSIVDSRIIAYGDLGAEALRIIKVKDLPTIAVIDCRGVNLYDRAPMEYRKEINKT